MSSGDVAVMGNFARPMIGFLLTLGIVAAATGFGAIQLANLAERRVPVRSEPELRNHESQDEGE
jgi:hypothetical protein